MNKRIFNKRKRIMKVISDMGAEILTSKGNLSFPLVNLNKNALIRLIDGPMVVNDIELVKIRPYWKKTRKKFKAGWVEFRLLKNVFKN